MQLGEGRLPEKTTEPFKDSIEIPADCVIDGQDVESIIDAIFDNADVADVANRAILMLQMKMPLISITKY